MFVALYDKSSNVPPFHTRSQACEPVLILTSLFSENLSMRPELLSIIDGLLAVRSAKLMAHVSGFLDQPTDGAFKWPSEGSVVITTRTKNLSRRNPKLLGPDGDQDVHRKCGITNYNIYNTACSGRYREEQMRNDYRLWRRFFIEQLHMDVKLNQALSELNAAERKVSSMQYFTSSLG